MKKLLVAVLVAAFAVVCANAQGPPAGASSSTAGGSGSGLPAGPTSPNSRAQICTETPSGGVASANCTWGLPGDIPTDRGSGEATYTFAATDIGTSVRETNAAGETFTIPDGNVGAFILPVNIGIIVQGGASTLQRQTSSQIRCTPNGALANSCALAAGAQYILKETSDFNYTLSVSGDGALVQVPANNITNVIAPTAAGIVPLFVLRTTSGTVPGADFYVCTNSAGACGTVYFSVATENGGSASLQFGIFQAPNYQGVSSTSDTDYNGGQDASAAGQVSSGIFRGSDNPSTSASAIAGSGVLRGGMLTGASVAGALSGEPQVIGGFLKGTAVANVGDVVCGTTTAFTVTDCSHTGPQVNIMGIATSTANPIGVVSDGQSLVKTDGAVTIGDTLCIGTTTDGLAHDSGGQGACATAGASIGVVIATSGNARNCEGACTVVTSVAMSTTLPLVQLHLGK
jgi:hypothetical protein